MYPHFIEPPQSLRDVLDAAAGQPVRFLHCVRMPDGTCFLHIQVSDGCFMVAARPVGDTWIPEDRMTDDELYELYDEFSAICHLEEAFRATTN